MRKGPVTFLVVIQRFLPSGEELRMVKQYQQTPEQQRDMLNRAIVGYDPHHPDGPSTAVYKFETPDIPAAKEKP